MIVAALAAGILVLKKWQKLPEAERASFAKKALLWGTVGVVLLLVAAGRAHWIMGVLAGLLAIAGRVAQFGQYVPLFKKMFAEQDEASPSPAGVSEMSKQEAADLLGVDLNASASEVRAAHKSLMQKIHPDRGGSDALAKQINHARDTLLG